MVGSLEISGYSIKYRESFSGAVPRPVARTRRHKQATAVMSSYRPYRTPRRTALLQAAVCESWRGA